MESRTSLSYNGKLILQENFKLPLNNRGFAYGDGFFETMLFEKAHCTCWEGHCERILEAALTLGYENLEEAWLKSLQSEISILLEKNNLTQSSAKVKLSFWRESGGLYMPSSSNAEWIIEANNLSRPHALPSTEMVTLQSIRNHPSITSSIKTISALHYVMAGKELRSHAAKEGLILDTAENISECTTSNLFWIKDNTIFTPDLNTGCVNGARRRIWMKQFEIKTGFFNKEALLNAEAVFTANAVGLKHISTLDGIALANYKESLVHIDRLIAHR